MTIQEFTQQSAQTKFKLGIVTTSGGTGNSVQKKIDYKNGRAVKDSNHSLNIVSGTYNDRAVIGMAGLAALLEGITNCQALTLGVSGTEVTQRLVTSAAYKEIPNHNRTIARTKECLHFPDDSAFFLLLDVDAEPGKETLKVNELRALLASVIPEFETVGSVVTRSTSSNIYDRATKELLIGEGNYHIFIPVRGDVERFKETLAVKLWAADLGFFKLATANKKTGVAAILERQPIDMSVFSPERLVYEAGALLPLTLEQRRGKPVFNEGTILDLNSIVATTEEIATAKINKDRARALLIPVQLEQAIDNISKNEPGLTREVAKTKAAKRIKDVDNGVLSFNHVLYLKDGRTIEAGELNETHLGTELADPQEPDYNNDKRCAKVVRVVGGGIGIASFAHGLRRYTIATKPAVLAPTAKRPGHLAIFMGDKAQASTIAAHHQMATIALDSIKAAYSIPSQLEQLEWPKKILLIPAAGDIANPTAIKAYRHIAGAIERENIAGKESQGKHWNPIVLSVWWEGQWDGNAIKMVAKTFTWKQWFSASVGADATAYKEWVEARKFTPDHTVNTKFFQFRQPAEGEMLVVRSGLGTGKTHWAIESVFKKMGKRAIFIVPTNNLGRSLNERSGASFMRELSTGTQYDSAYKATDVDVVTLCLDSILLVSVEQATGAVIFIDELEIVMRVLAIGSTHIRKIRPEAADHLRAVLAVAHSVVGLDGGMTDRGAAFLHELCPSKKLVKVLNAHSNTMTFNVDLGTEDEYKGRLTKAVARANDGTDRPLFLATDSKADGRVNIQFPLNADTIKEALMQEDGKLLPGWGAEMAKNPTAFIKKNNARTASVSTAGGAGLSFDLYDYFGSNPVLGMGVVGPADLMQLAGRIRDNSIVRDMWIAPQGLKEYWILDADAVTEMAVGEALFRFLQEGYSACGVPDINKAMKLMANLHKAIAVDPIAQFVIKEQALRAYECKHLRGLTIAAARMNGHIVNLVTYEETELEAELTKEAVKEHKAAKRCHKLDFIGRFQFAAKLTEEEENAANNADRLAPGMQERLALTAIAKKYPGIQATPQWNDMSGNEKGEITSHVFIDRLPKFGKKATEFFFLSNPHFATKKAQARFNRWLNDQAIDLTQLGANIAYSRKMRAILLDGLEDFVGLSFKSPIGTTLTVNTIEGCKNAIGSSINKDLLEKIVSKLLTGTARKTLNGRSKQRFLKEELEKFGFGVEKVDDGLFVTAPCLDPETDLGAVYGTVCSRYEPKKAEDEQPHEWEFTASIAETEDLEGAFSAIVRGKTEEGYSFEVVYEFEDSEASRSPVFV